MNIKIETTDFMPAYGAGTPVFPEAWFVLNEWQMQGKIVPSSTAVVNGISYFENGPVAFEPKIAELNILTPKFSGVSVNGLITQQPLVWEADSAIFDLPMLETAPSWLVPLFDEIVDPNLPNTSKFTSTGTSLKLVGEWPDSLCEVWLNPVLNKIQIYTNPVNNLYLSYPLIRAFTLEYTIAKHPILAFDTQLRNISTAEANRISEGNWVKQQPL